LGGGAVCDGVARVGRSSFLKKRSKRLLDGCRGLTGSVRQVTKVFWFFFSKKNRFLSLELQCAAS
jgi:hypothetical protein